MCAFHFIQFIAIQKRINLGLDFRAQPKQLTVQHVRTKISIKKKNF